MGEKAKAAKCLLMKDGTVRKVPEDQCDHMISSGQAKRYVSRTIYKAVQLGIEVKNFGDRDDKGTLRMKIAAARESEKAKRQKAEAKKKDRQKELSKMEEAQVVLNGDD